MKKPVTGTIVKDIEPSDIKLLCESPQTILNFILNNIIFETEDTGNFIIKEKKPVGDEKKLFWIKNSFPYGIGMLIDGEYRMDFGMSGYPVNSPFLHAPIGDLKEGLRQLSGAEITSYGIPDTTAGASARMLWYIFEPTF